MNMTGIRPQAGIIRFGDTAAPEKPAENKPKKKLGKILAILGLATAAAAGPLYLLSDRFEKKPVETQEQQTAPYPFPSDFRIEDLFGR